MQNALSTPANAESQPPAASHRAFKVTRPGWYWLGINLLFLGIGFGKDINLLLLLSYTMLVIFFLNMMRAGRQLPRLQARRRFPDHIFARAPCTVAIEVLNTGRDKAALRIEDGRADHFLSWFVPWLARRETRTLHGDVVLPHRGRYNWGPVWAVSGYPFGLFERRRRIGAEIEVLVLPALGFLHRGRFLRWLRGADVREEEARRKLRRHPTAQAEFHGLRPFRPGDSPRLIHWRTSARRGELMMREYEDAPGQNLIVVVELRVAKSEVRLEENSPSTIRNPQTEAAISLAATLCWEWCRRRGDRLIVAVAGAEPLVFDDLAGPDHGRRILEALAVAQPSAETNEAGLLQRLTVRPLTSAALVVIGTEPSRLADLLSARLRRPAVCLDATDLANCDFYEPPEPKGGRMKGASNDF